MYKRQDQLRWAVLLILLYNVGIQAIMGVATYYFSYVCNNAGMLSAFMISASVAEVVGLLILSLIHIYISKSVDNLRTKGFVVLIEDDNDRRKRHIELTQKAEEAAKEMLEVHNDCKRIICLLYTSKTYVLNRKIAGCML